ncbi:hypothetical protein EKPJFOCH_2999 [Methylobacterium thuringiense]|uniref:EAL domain-containing protein n=2 Tax=Methylobacterium thuringiense TaxID=1003091 RepID=A0ABQ4TPF0_9HYPH|nr:hypothetical protein EKPJFOCH_2999 [Methylobacterium thuringiense]
MQFQNKIDGTTLLRPEMTLSSSDAYRDSDLDANAMQNDFRMLLEAVSDYAVYRLTPEGNVSSWNKGAERNKGYTFAEAIGLHVSAFYTAEDRAAGAPARTLAAAAESKFETHGWRVRKDGSRFWAHVVLEAIRDPDGRLVGFAKVTCDVTAQKIDRDGLVRNLDAALSNMSQGLCLFDAEERLVLANSRMAEICGLSAGEIVPGTPFVDIVRALLGRRRMEPAVSVGALYGQQRALILQAGGGGAVLKMLPDTVVSVIHRPMADGSWVTTIEDISDRSRSQDQIAHMAMHDALTDLPNRVMFRQRLDDALRRVKRGEPCAVLCLDLDRFKTINDTLGHPVGDTLLVSVAEQLRGLVRETDTVARLGGDEFAIVQTNVGHPDDSKVLADRLIRALSVPKEIDGHLVASGVSIGIALAPGDGMDPDQILKSADLALYRAKAHGRGRYCYFEPGMDVLPQERRRLELDLRTALAANQFELYYQPIVDIERDLVCGFEALIRWHSPQRGLVPPADFIPLAEEIGLIVDIGAWVLHSACREAAAWPEHIKVAVNVSVAQFRGFGLVDTVRSALAASGLAPTRLEIEITESIMINDSAHTCAVLHQLKALGLSISMDDFGTGYSSLGYLRSFPFDKIKIDRSFIEGLGEAADCNAIVQAVMGICDSLGIIATAEGVENQEQIAQLKSRNCHQAQGYLYSKPRPSSEVNCIIDRIDLQVRH